jgi:hypothetical protein
MQPYLKLTIRIKLVFQIKKYFIAPFKIKTCGTITLPEVPMGCETRSLMVREEQNVKVIESSVTGTQLGLKMDEMIGG